VSEPTHLKLADVLAALVEEYEGEVSYPRLYRATIERRFPVRRDGRLYTIAREDLPRVAERFGLRPRLTTAA
jgi:hypothetical protein